ncbi:MAG: V-type ATP synthase subunit E [Christensenellales bacterium]|jgi:vacuolar-type H+-ATPase subunit E/Vma4
MSQGKDEIIKKIKKDAEKIAVSTLEEAGEKAKELIAAAHNDAAIFKQNYMEKSYALRQEILQREENAARLEVKKITLAKKQELIGAAYQKAIDLIRQDKSGYLKLLEAMLSKTAQKGRIIFSEADKDIAVKFLQDYNKKHNAEFSLSQEFGAFCGGVKVEGEETDTDMTLEAEIALLREETEPEAAKLIFGAAND